MSNIKLNKYSLGQENNKLKNYKLFLPSLELKRKKLISERNKAIKQLKVIEEELLALKNRISQHFCMTAYIGFDLSTLIKIDAIDMKEENIVGVKLPTLIDIHIEKVKYPFFNAPYWLERYLNAISDLIQLEIKRKTSLSRLAALDKAVKTVTQRTNLLDKVLIPKTRNNIRTIQIYLADNERAAMVRAKIAKARR